MAKTIKVKVCETLEIDVEAWASEFGVDEKDVRADVAAYFARWCSEQAVGLGLGKAAQ